MQNKACIFSNKSSTIILAQYDTNQKTAIKLYDHISGCIFTKEDLRALAGLAVI